MKLKKSPFCFLFAASCSLLAISYASAQDQDGTWGNTDVPAAGATSSNWTATTMWSGDMIANGVGFTANFTGIDITGNKIVNLNGDRTIGNITFTDSTASNDLTISGNTLTLDVTTGAPQINVTNQNLTISSIIAGDEGLTKTGAGGLILSGGNSYTGSTSISAGTLTLNNVGALGDTSAITIGGAAPATLAANVDGITTAAPITTADSGVNSTISFAINPVTPAAAAITLNGAIGGAGNVIFSTPATFGSGGSTQTINLGAQANYAGSTTINPGSFPVLTVKNTSGAADVLPPGTVLTFGPQIGNGGGRTSTFDLNGQDQTLAGLTQPANIPNDRNYRVTSATAATLTINNTANFSFGGTNIDNGTSIPGTVTSAQITGAISLVKEGSGTFTLGGNLTNGATAAGHTYTGTTQIDGGILTFGGKAYKTAGIATAAATGSIGLGVKTGDVAFYSATDVGDLFNTNTLTGFSLDPGSGVAIDTTNAGASFDQTVALTAARSLTKLGANTLILSQANTYTGGTTLSGGLTIASINGALGSGAINFSGTATGLQLGDLIDLTNNITIGTNTGVAGQGLIKVANGQSATLSGTITINNNAGFGSHFGGTSTTGTGILNITNAITSTVTVSQRSGTVVLSGGGIYSNFNLAAGTLKLGALNGFSTGSALTIANAAGENATFDLAGFNQSLVGITKGSGSTATIGNSSTTADSTLTTTGTSTFAGIIQDTLGSGDQTVALTVANGSLTLSGVNTYSGETTVTGGTLKLNNPNANNESSTVSIAASGATLELNFDETGGPVTDTVDKLFIGGVQQNAGVYKATDNVTDSGTSISQITGPGTLTVTTGPGASTPYDTWANDKGLTALNNAKNLNPDNDGLNNLAEFAFNGDPLSGSDNGKVYVLTEDSDTDSLKELILTVAVRTGTAAFSGSPSPTAIQAADGITYTIEGSLDLASFPTTVTVVSPITAGLPAAGTGYEYRSFSLSGSNGLSGKGFLRAKVTSP